MRLLVSPDGDGYKVLPSRDGETVFSGLLEVRETSKGPRPARLRVRRGDGDETRQPDEFVDLARMAEEVLYPASADGFGEMAELLDAYGVGLRREEVCRLCLVNGRFTSLWKDDAVLYDGERICVDCARDELRREASFRGVSSATRRSRSSRSSRFSKEASTPNSPSSTRWTRTSPNPCRSTRRR
jgi:helicase